METKQTVIKKRLNKIFQSVFNDPTIEITEAMTAKDIDGWDSLMHITLIISVEKEFNIRFKTSEVGKMENIGSLLQVLEERTAG